VSIAGRRQPDPDVQELPDARLGNQEAHRTGQECPLRPHRDPDIRVRRGDLLGDGRSAAKMSLPPSQKS